MQASLPLTKHQEEEDVELLYEEVDDEDDLVRSLSLLNIHRSFLLFFPNQFLSFQLIILTFRSICINSGVDVRKTCMRMKKRRRRRPRRTPGVSVVRLWTIERYDCIVNAFCWHWLLTDWYQNRQEKMLGFNLVEAKSCKCLKVGSRLYEFLWIPKATRLRREDVMIFRV